MKDLVKFHADNKYFFMAYNQNILKQMVKLQPIMIKILLIMYYLNMKLN